MKDTVLILAPGNDAHAEAVAAELAAMGVRPVVWDSGGLPESDSFTFTLSGETLDFQLRVGETRVDLSGLRSVWWRRPARPTIAGTVSDPDVRRFCAKECDTFLRGALEALGVPVFNHPTAEAAAARKPLQLRAAQRVGLPIPRTL